MCWIGVIVSCNVNMGFVRFPYLAQTRPQSRLSFLAGGTLVRGGSVERLTYRLKPFGHATYRP